MGNKLAPVFLIIMGAFNPAFGQLLGTSVSVNSSLVDNTYSRKTIACVFGKTSSLSGEYGQLLQDAASINLASMPDRFDKLVLPKTIIKSDGGSDATERMIAEERLSNHMLAQIWSRNRDGSFGFDYLRARSSYNATEWDKFIAGASFKGDLVVLDQSEKLVQATYIVVIEPGNIRTADQYYDSEDAKKKERAKQGGEVFIPGKRTEEGFVCDLNVSVFKLIFDETVQNYFYDKLWVDKSTNSEERARRIRLFDDYLFPVEYVISQTQSNVKYLIEKSSNGQIRQPKELFSGLLNKCVESSYDKLEAFFPLSQAISKVEPITAQLGRKEGVGVGQRFHVYEFVGSPGSKVIKKKLVGVLKSTGIRPSLSALQKGERPTIFVQTYGRKLDVGMQVVERKEVGIGFSALTGTGGVSGLFFRADINVSTALGRSVNLGNGLRVGLGLGFHSPADQDDYQRFVNFPGPYTFTRIQFDLFKDFYVAPQVVLQAGLGLGKTDAEDRVTNPDESYQVASMIHCSPMFGFGLSVHHSIRFLVLGSYMLPLMVSDNDDWGRLFPGRIGPAVQVGLHFDVL